MKVINMIIIIALLEAIAKKITIEEQISSKERTVEVEVEEDIRYYHKVRWAHHKHQLTRLCN